MYPEQSLTLKDADRILKGLGLELSTADKVEFLHGLEVESEHLDTAGGDWATIGLIVLDHLAEDPGYYRKLKKAMHEHYEAEAERAAWMEAHESGRENPMREPEDVPGFYFGVIEHEKPGAFKGRIILAAYTDERMLAWIAAIPTSMHSETATGSGVRASAFSKLGEAYLDNANVVWTVGKAHAWESGWGPLMYEALLAFVAAKGYSGWITSDTMMTSKEARAVWRKFSERDDVEYLPEVGRNVNGAPIEAMRALPELLNRRESLLKSSDKRTNYKRLVKTFLRDPDPSGYFFSPPEAHPAIEELRNNPQKGAVTVELLCCMTPDGDEVAEQRTEETKQMYDKADRLLKDHGARLDVFEHYDFGDQTSFADAYARIPISKLIEVLDSFDEHGIVYDNIDLPEGAPQDLVAALNKRYPARSGVMVNRNNPKRTNPPAAYERAAWMDAHERGRSRRNPTAVEIPVAELWKDQKDRAWMRVRGAPLTLERMVSGDYPESSNPELEEHVESFDFWRGRDIEPIYAEKINGKWWIHDGLHRLAAAKADELEAIPVFLEHFNKTPRHNPSLKLSEAALSALETYVTDPAHVEQDVLEDEGAIQASREILENLHGRTLTTPDASDPERCWAWHARLSYGAESAAESGDYGAAKALNALASKCIDPLRRESR